ncbi:MAG: 2'-5' RNA ligase family protein [Tetrasphaera sp.]
MPTIGVAVAIPEPHAGFLQERRESFGDPLAHAIPPHVTLLPPTVVDVNDLAAFEEHLAKVAATHPSFDIALESTGTFRPVSPVVFVRLTRGMAECEALESAIRTGPVVRELDFDYHPHVTVAHQISEEELDAAFVDLDDFAVTFHVPAFHLYHHGDDDVWRPVRGFDLQGE